MSTTIFNSVYYLMRFTIIILLIVSNCINLEVFAAAITQTTQKNLLQTSASTATATSASASTTTKAKVSSSTIPLSSSVAAAAAAAGAGGVAAAPLKTRDAAELNFFSLCPNMLHYVFESATPHDEAQAGVFEEYSAAEGDFADDVDLRGCLAACCEKSHNNTCNVVFVFKRKCYHVRCVSNEACLPKERKGMKERLQMILVNPVVSRTAVNNDENISWLDVLKTNNEFGMNALLPIKEQLLLSGERNSPLSFWKQPPHKFQYATSLRNQEPTTYDEDDFPLAEKRMKQLLMTPAEDGDNMTPNEIAFFNANLPGAAEAAAAAKFIPCDVLLSELGNRCPEKEECVPLHANSASGICKCQRGYIRNQLRICVPQLLDYQLVDESGGGIKNLPTLISAATSQDSPSIIEAAINKKGEEIPEFTTEPVQKPEDKKKLIVEVESKIVQLPEKEVALVATTVPKEEEILEEGGGIINSKFSYLWTLISQPKGPMNGTITDQSESKVKLSNLSEGLYTFKVTVTAPNGTYGEAMANVTVLPEKRINRIPQVVISPSVQIIRQPTTNAILDGSTSSDDDKIINWHWEVVSGPIGYQPKLLDVTTLQLTDLNLPGNYTFKLTVTDSDNVTNSTIANITVLRGTDYPPVANAGDAVILYLPNNNVTLNGTASSDDHDIVAWEWTKDANDESKAVDMQNTRTPYVQLSNLEEGMYTFVLKVTDASGQSSSAKVHVFVKPPTNTPPVAVAYKNMTINLPRNWALLNGSLSHDDIHIKSFDWHQIQGPKKAVIINATSAIANATSLTLGLYQFELTVLDDNNNNASDSLYIKIVQERNAAPIANAGGDQIVTLPISAIYLNGSQSSDDLAVVKYVWTREDDSLATGTIVGDTDKQPILILSNVVHGHYIFKLTVYDDQGLSNSNIVSITVQPDPMLLNLIQLTLPMGVTVLTQGELNTIVQKIGLLVGDMKVYVRELKYDEKTEATILVFYVESTDSAGHTQPVNGLIIERLLKDKLQRDASILGAEFADIRTTICQNECSGHGVCNAITRSCICEAFWMPSITYYWGIEQANCDWSILYVFVSVIVSFLLLSGMFWFIACTFRKQQNKKPRSRPKVQKYSLIGNQDEETPNGEQQRVFKKKMRKKLRRPFLTVGGRNTTSLTDSDTDSDVLFETRTKPNGILRSANGNAKSGNNCNSINKNNTNAIAQQPLNNINNKYAITKLGRKIKT